MEYPRRSIPSVSGLIAFEATARYLSFSRAAEELALTQGAVSKRVRQLETVLGSELLVRNTNQVCLTEIGQIYLGHTRKLLRQLHASTEDIQASAHGVDAIRVAAPTEFAIRWLVPRLAGFARAFPNCSVNLLSGCLPDDPRLADVHCAVFDGQAPWRDAETSTLVSGANVVVGCASAIRDLGRVTPQKLVGMPLLTCNRTPHLWRRWFASIGFAEQPFNDIRFDELAVLVEAAIAGQGVALLPEFLVSDDLRNGRLHVLFPESRLGHVHYSLAIQPSHRNSVPVRNFVDWIKCSRSQETEIFYRGKLPAGEARYKTSRPPQQIHFHPLDAAGS